MKKAFDEKLEMILNEAERLFMTKGYELTTVDDIIKALGIAKGTFYYYVKSKEEVMDLIIERVTKQAVDKANEVVNNDQLPPKEKLMFTFLSINMKSDVNDALLDIMHQPSNALMHQKSLTSIVEHLAPLLDKVIDEGIWKGEFKVDYPKEYMMIFLTSVTTLLDDGMFKLDQDEQAKMFRALIALLENMLGVEKDCFWEMITRQGAWKDYQEVGGKKYESNTY